MKRFLVTILAIIYLAVSSGATVHLHYCMGKLRSWSLSDKGAAKCVSCGMHKAGHTGCCHDELKQVKLEKDQKITDPSFLFLSISPLASPVTFDNGSVIYSSSLVINYPTAHAPPRSGTVPVFVLNCNFRI